MLFEKLEVFSILWKVFVSFNMCSELQTNPSCLFSFNFRGKLQCPYLHPCPHISCFSPLPLPMVQFCRGACSGEVVHVLLKPNWTEFVSTKVLDFLGHVGASCTERVMWRQFGESLHLSPAQTSSTLKKMGHAGLPTADWHHQHFIYPRAQKGSHCRSIHSISIMGETNQRHILTKRK